MTLTFSDANSNVGLGASSLLAITAGGTGNTALGTQSLQSAQMGTGNVAVGSTALQSIIGTGIGDGNNNVAIGGSAANGIISGSANVIIGFQAGANYFAGTESNNITISNQGTTGENSVTRIGTSQTLAYMAGIQGVTPTNGPLQTVVIGTDGQLGSTSSSGSSTLAYTLVNNAASPYTVLSSDQFIGVDSSGGGVTILLPNAPTTGTSFYIKDAAGFAGIFFITITTVGGVVLLDAAATYTIQYLYGSINLLFNGTQYLIY
jgi:hypothetical protein